MSITRQRAAAVALGLIFGVGTVAVHAAPAPGSCSHPRTIQALEKTIGGGLMGGIQSVEEAKAIANAFKDKAVAVNFTGIRTMARDAAVGRSICGASLRVQVPADTFRWLAVDLNVADQLARQRWRRDGSAHALVRDVRYSSQLTDDGTQVYAELDEGAAVGGAVGLISAAAWVAFKAGASGASTTPEPGAAATRAAPVADGICAGLDTSTTVGASDCQGRYFKQADDALNANYKAAMARLPADLKTALRKEQRAWLAVRDSGCVTEVEQRGLGGTAADLEIAGCVTGKTRARAAELAAYR